MLVLNAGASQGWNIFQENILFANVSYFVQNGRSERSEQRLKRLQRAFLIHLPLTKASSWLASFETSFLQLLSTGQQTLTKKHMDNTYTQKIEYQLPD